MCQAAPGPRCFNDTSKVLRTRTSKITVTREKLAGANAALESAMRDSNFASYARCRKNVSDLDSKLSELITIRRYDRRDAYGTKTGSKKLAQRIQNASTDVEAEALRRLAVQAEALRFSREHALAKKRAGYVPVIRFAKAA
jgi:hypothetical protein